MTTFNIYCDESSHLEHDANPVMVLGAIWCPAETTRELIEALRLVKLSFGFSADFEVKWTKVSPSRVDFYRAYLDVLFEMEDVSFRGLVAPKASLDHSAFGQTHDDWYYKMYFEQLKQLLRGADQYRIYLDIKDSHGGRKSRTLRSILSAVVSDHDRTAVERIQIVRSHELEPIQLADLVAGAVNFANSDHGVSTAKADLVERLRQRSSTDLLHSTSVSRRDFNLFHWRPAAHP